MGGTTVPRKLQYRIGEACRAVDIQPYVLRYWETEFEALGPGKSKSGQRVYSEHEIGVIRRIKELLYEEGYTIAGAKKRLAAELEDGRYFASPEADGELFESGSGAEDEAPVIALDQAEEARESPPEHADAAAAPESVVGAAEAREEVAAVAVTVETVEPAATVEPTRAQPAAAAKASRRRKGAVALTPEPSPAAVESPPPASSGAVDSPLSKRVETLEHGIRRVLDEVRHLRSLLADSSDDR